MVQGSIFPSQGIHASLMKSIYVVTSTNLFIVSSLFLLYTFMSVISFPCPRSIGPRDESFIAQ